MVKLGEPPALLHPSGTAFAYCTLARCRQLIASERALLNMGKYGYLLCDFIVRLCVAVKYMFYQFY